MNDLERQWFIEEHFSNLEWNCNRRPPIELKHEPEDEDELELHWPARNVETIQARWGKSYTRPEFHIDLDDE